MQLDFRLENLADIKPWLLSLAVVALFVAGNYLVYGGPHYETPDDANFSMLVGGFGLVDQPDYHIYFSHFLIGKMLAFLHSVSQKTPWYAIYIVTSQVIAMTVTVRILMSKCTSKTTAALFAFVFLYFGCTRWVYYLQFTSTASLVAIASGLLALVALEKRQLRRTSAICLVGSLSLLFFASLIRAWSAQLMVAMVAFALFFRYIQLKDWKRLKVGAIVIAISAGIVALTYVSNENHYDQSNGWREWRAMNKAWWPFRDFESAKAKLGSTNCQKVGWTAADLNIFRAWYVLDANTFSVEKLKEISKAPGDYSRFVRQFEQSAPDVAVCMLALLTVVIGALKSKLSWQARILFVVAVLAMSVAILLATKLPVRVYGPLLTFTLTVFLWYTKPSSLRGLISKPPNLATAVCSWLVLLGLSAALIVDYRANSAMRSARSQELRADFIAINPKQDDLYVRWLLSVPVHNLRPFEPYYDELINMKTLNITTTGRSPHNLSRMKQFGITDLPAQLDKEHVYLASQDRYNVLLDNYIVSKYRKKPIFEPVFATNPNFTIFKVKYVSLKDFPGTDLSPLCPAPTATDLSLFKDVSISGLLVKTANDSYKKVSRTGQAMILYKPDKALALSRFSHFFVELSAGKWQYERRAEVHVKGDDGRRSVLSSLFLLPDSKLHRYAIPLSDEQKKMNLTELIVIPAWTKFSKAPFKLGNLGFLHTDKDSRNSISIAAKRNAAKGIPL